LYVLRDLRGFLRVQTRFTIGALLAGLALAFVRVGAGAEAGMTRLRPDPTTRPGGVELAPHHVADLVVLVSLDGFRPDVMGPETRHLHRLYLQGASPHVARTIEKSATLPSHASMVSGVQPSQHGLDFNAFKPERGHILSPTIFSVTHDAGLPVSMFVGKGKLRHLLGDPREAAFKVSGMHCDKLVDQALPTLREAKQGLLFLHFADADSAGHRTGWMTADYLKAAHRADQCLGRVIDTIEESVQRDRILLLVTADHGGHNRSHGTRLDVDQRIPWFAWGAGVRRGRFSRPVHTTDTAATVLSALGLALPAGMQGHPVFDAFSSSNGPRGLPITGAAIEP
jgi:hypothetical protein